MNGDTRLRDGLGPRASPAGSAAAGSGAPKGPASGPGVYAALDLGTNNCRLLIACPVGDGFRVVDSFSRIIRLGEGISATGCISDALGLSCATEAFRSLSNAVGFRERVAAETGIRLEVIDRETEAALAVIGWSPPPGPQRRGAPLFYIGGAADAM